VWKSLCFLGPRIADRKIFPVLIIFPIHYLKISQDNPPMIVMKFGGTSNEDATAMRNVLRIVSAHRSEFPVVVISAIARATNELEQTARLAHEGREEEAVATVTALFERHTRIMDNLLTGRAAAAELEQVLFQYLNEIKAMIRGIATLRELTPRTLDAICSYGERSSSRIIAAGLCEAGVSAAWVDAREFMVTDDAFGRAQPLMDIVTERLATTVRPLLDRSIVPVTQGFIGVTLSGEYTTMGRESSDYSASIIGAAMQARRVQIWTDVDGILTADPRLVQGTRKIERMSFEEAFELSYFGAKVLHPGTMLPLLERNIPVQILNSKNSEGSGTWVDTGEGERQPAHPLKSIAFRKGLTVLTVSPRKRLNQFLFWEGVYGVLNGHRVTPGLTATSEYSLACAVESRFVTESMIHALEELGITSARSGCASICVVGAGIRGAAEVPERLFRALAGLSILLVSHGASASSLTLVLEEQAVPQALERLHREFFGGPADAR
jgi:aspartate kinase